MENENTPEFKFLANLAAAYGGWSELSGDTIGRAAFGHVQNGEAMSGTIVSIIWLDRWEMTTEEGAAEAAAILAGPRREMECRYGDSKYGPTPYLVERVQEWEGN